MFGAVDGYRRLRVGTYLIVYILKLYVLAVDMAKRKEKQSGIALFELLDEEKCRHFKPEFRTVETQRCNRLKPCVKLSGREVVLYFFQTLLP